jgi:hypothetical protein
MHFGPVQWNPCRGSGKAGIPQGKDFGFEEYIMKGKEQK